jgi:hypothetical protein
MIYETVRKCVDDLNSRWSDLQSAAQNLATLLASVPAQQGIVNGWAATSASQVSVIQAQLPGLNGFPSLIALISIAQTNIFNPTFAQFTLIRNAALGAGGLLPVLAGSADGRISASAGLVESSIRALEGLCAECMQELAEFTSNEGARANLSGIRGSVDDISTYPVFTQDFSFGGGSPSLGRGQAAPTSLSLTAQRALSDVLGRRPRLDDPKSFLAALTQSFTCKDVEGHTECTWVQRGAAGLTELGGSITGAQASMYQRAKAAYDNAKPLIDLLTPLRTDPDLETIQAVRSIVSTEFQELVNEMGFEGGPRVSRVNDLLNILLHQNFPLAPPRTGQISDLANRPFFTAFGAGEIGHLGDQLGMTRDNVNSIEDEQNLTNFLVVRDYVNSLEASWQTFEPSFLGGAENYLGTQLILLQRNLSVIAESVSEVSFAMDSVFLGQAERLTVRIEFPANIAPPMYVADLLTWVETFATGEGTQIIQEGGKIGVRAIVQPLQRLRDLVRNSDGRIRHPGARHPRVRRTLEELASQLAEAARLAATVQ